MEGSITNKYLLCPLAGKWAIGYTAFSKDNRPTGETKMTCFVLRLDTVTKTWKLVAACNSKVKAEAIANEMRKAWHQVKITEIQTVKTERSAVAA
jgi:hypothetical protein